MRLLRAIMGSWRALALLVAIVLVVAGFATGVILHIGGGGGNVSNPSEGAGQPPAHPATQTQSAKHYKWVAKRALVECSFDPPIRRLTQAGADRLFARATSLFANKIYGPRLGLPVSAPDRCRLGDHGFDADCEGEFAAVGQAFPKCGQEFSIFLVGLHKAPRGTRAVITSGLSGFCHDPSELYAEIYGP